MTKLGTVPRLAAAALLLLAATKPAPASSSDAFDCHENCYFCTGPGEYECTVCKNGFCMEDESYRIAFYEGEGRCWNVTCGGGGTVDDGSDGSAVRVWVVLGGVMVTTVWMAVG